MHPGMVRLSHYRKQSATTLVELLVAAIILSALIALLLPSIGMGRRLMNAATCVSNLKQIGEAVVTYAGEHNQFLPPSYASPGEPNRVLAERDWYQYLYHQDLLLCENRGVLPNQNLSPNKPNIRSAYNCPANPDRIWLWSTPNYAYNLGLGLNDRRANLTRVSTPGRVILAVDAGIRSPGSLSPTDGPPNVLFYATSYSSTSFHWEKSVNFGVHNGRANFVMLDGHVESLKHDEVAIRGASRTLLWSQENAPGLESTW